MPTDERNKFRSTKVCPNSVLLLILFVVIRIDSLSLKQGEFSLDNIRFTIPTGEYGILMGPTGCGNSHARGIIGNVST